MAPRVASDYGSNLTGASLSVLIELLTVLGKHKAGLTLVGGWAPFFLLKKHQSNGDAFTHVGSIDIDMAVDPHRIDEDAYASIVDLLQDRKYSPKTNKEGQVIPASYERTITKGSEEFVIQVDFLTAAGPGRQSHRHEVIQGTLHARKARGCDAAFEHYEVHEIRGVLPGGGTKTTDVRVADLTGILAMKGIALGERFKEKDAYDIHSSIAHYQNGPVDGARAVLPSRGETTVREGLTQIRTDFGSADSNGSQWVGDFLAPDDPASREVHRVDALLTLTEFFRVLDAS